MKFYIFLLSLFYTLSFGGNASYLEVSINYLSGENRVIVGSDTNKDEILEILVSLLDIDGNLADRDINGDYLNNIEVKSSIEVLKASTDQQLGINRSLNENKNIGRYILDYSDVAISVAQEDEITVIAGGKKYTKIINLSSADAKGLIVRIAPHTQFETDNYINKDFVNIEMSDEPSEYNLSKQSSRAPGTVAGSSIPISIYASTLAPAGKNSVIQGRFTVAPNLEGKNIIVKTMGNYALGTEANVTITTSTFEMKRGVAKGVMKITYALPSETRDVPTFEPSLTGGLPIAFIAYVEDDIKIANKQSLDLEDEDTFKISGDNNDTDTIKMRSGDVYDMKVGIFDNNAIKLKDLWSKTEHRLYVANGDGVSTFEDSSLNEANITLTVVDSYDNPVYIKDASKPNTAIITFSDESTSEHFLYESNSSTSSSGTELIDKDDNISTYAWFKIKDNDANITKAQTLSIDFRKGILSRSQVKKISLSHMPLIKSEKHGHSAISNFVTTSTTLELNVTRKDESYTTTMAEVDVKLQLKASSQAGEFEDGVKEIIELRIYDPRGGFLSESEFEAKFEIKDGSNSITITKDRDGVADLNITNGRVISIFKKNGNLLATLTFSEKYKASVAKGNTATIQLRAYEDRRISAYVDVGLLDYDRRNDYFPGQEIEFKFSGDGIGSGDNIYIEFNGTSGKVGLASQPYEDTLTSIIDTTLTNSKKIIVKLFETNSSDMIYTIGDIKINDANVTYRTVEENRDIDTIYELVRGEEIKIERFREKGAFAIKALLGATSSNGDGSDKYELLALESKFSPSTETTSKLIVYDGELKTNTYYNLFDSSTKMKVQDKYENDIDDRATTNTGFDRYYELKGTSGVEVDMERGDDAWIKFTKEASGTTQSVKVYYIDKPEVFFEIKFTDIEYSAEQNEKFQMSMDIGTQNYIIVNSEVVVKIKPDGNKDQTDTSLKITHSDSTAKVTMVLTSANSPSPGSEFDSSLNDNDESIETIYSKGSYYIISADKPGTVTLTAKSTIDSRTSTTRKEEIVEGKIELIIVSADSRRPDIDPTTDIKVIGDKITVKVVDINLNILDTKVTLFTQNNEHVQDAVYKDGLFVFTKLEIGIYRIAVDAVDFSNVVKHSDYVREITNGVAPTTTTTPTQPIQPAVMNYNDLEDALTKKSYPIKGLFYPYNFGADARLNFAYYDYSTNKTYQFHGKTPTATDLFGFKEVQLTTQITQDEYSFYMIQLDGVSGSIDAAGPLGWVIFRKTTLTKVSKLSGATTTGDFAYKTLNLVGTLIGPRTVQFKKQ